MSQVMDYQSVITITPSGLAAGMPSIGGDERIDRILIPEDCIQRRVQALADQIAGDYARTTELHLVVVLKGAFVFAADLGRAIHKAGGPDVKYSFLKAVTYGTEIKTSGEPRRRVRIQLEPDNMEGKDALLIDDIVDQAFTMSKARELLETHNVKSVKTCALLYKILDDPGHEVGQLKNSLPIDYIGFTVPDRWVAGYGIDAGGDFRHLPYIVAVKEEYYTK